MTQPHRLTDPDPILLTPAEEEAVEGLVPIPIDEEAEAVEEIGVSGEYDPDTGWVTVNVTLGDQAAIILGWQATEEGSWAIDVACNSIPQALAAVLPELFPGGDDD